MVTLVTAFDAIGVAIECMKTGGPDRWVGDRIGIEAAHFGLSVHIPYRTPMRSVLAHRLPDSIDLAFEPKLPDPPGDLVYGFASVQTSVTWALFGEFYERHAPWVKAKFGGDCRTWPRLFDFARVIRNFILHHNGRVHFDNPNAPPVTWHHLTYSPADEGKQAVGPSQISVARSAL